MTDSVLIPTLVAAAACFMVVGTTHALLHIIKRRFK